MSIFQVIAMVVLFSGTAPELTQEVECPTGYRPCGPGCCPA